MSGSNPAQTNDVVESPQPGENPALLHIQPVAAADGHQVVAAGLAPPDAQELQQVPAQNQVDHDDADPPIHIAVLLPEAINPGVAEENVAPVDQVPIQVAALAVQLPAAQPVDADDIAGYPLKSSLKGFRGVLFEEESEEEE